MGQAKVEREERGPIAEGSTWNMRMGVEFTPG
jgi:hypothetical protein